MIKELDLVFWIMLCVLSRFINLKVLVYMSHYVCYSIYVSVYDTVSISQCVCYSKYVTVCMLH